MNSAQSMRFAEVERVNVKDIGLAAIRERYIDTSTPVIIEGLADQWELTKWDVNRIAERAGDERIQLIRNGIGLKAGLAAPARTTSLREYLACAESRSEESAAYYYITKDIPSAVAEHVQPLPFHGPWLPQLFCVGFQSFTALHCHLDMATFLCMLQGEKRVVMFPPADTKNLYMRCTANFSQVEDPEAADLRMFPLLARCRGLVGTIRAGDMLYHPLYWWHSVRSTDLSVMIAFHRWEPSHLRRWISPNGWKVPVVQMARMLRHVRKEYSHRLNLGSGHAA